MKEQLTKLIEKYDIPPYMEHEVIAEIVADLRTLLSEIEK